MGRGAYGKWPLLWVESSEPLLALVYNASLEYAGLVQFRTKDFVGVPAIYPWTCCSEGKSGNG